MFIWPPVHLPHMKIRFHRSGPPSRGWRNAFSAARSQTKLKMLLKARRFTESVGLLSRRDQTEWRRALVLSSPVQSRVEICQESSFLPSGLLKKKNFLNVQGWTFPVNIWAAAMLQLEVIPRSLSAIYRQNLSSHFLAHCERMWEASLQNTQVSSQRPSIQLTFRLLPVKVLRGLSTAPVWTYIATYERVWRGNKWRNC